MAYAVWDAFEITVSARDAREVEDQAKELSDRKLAIERKLRTLDSLGGEYSMAAKLRYGDVQYGHALKLNHAPFPMPIATNTVVIVKYQAALNQGIAQRLAAAKQEWTTVLVMAQQAGVANPWSQAAQDHLAIVFPNALTPVP